MALVQTNKNTNQSTAQVEFNKKPTVFNTFKRDYQLWLLLLPAVLCVIIFNYVHVWDPVSFS